MSQRYDWFKSYLCGQTQYVTISGKTSLIETCCMVYCKDLYWDRRKNCTFIMYDDDANILISGCNIAEIDEIVSSLAKK